MGFKMKGWKAFTTKDHSNNKPDGRAGSSAFQQKEGFEAYKPGAAKPTAPVPKDVAKMTKDPREKAKEKMAKEKMAKGVGEGAAEAITQKAKNKAKDKYIRQSPHPRDEASTKLQEKRARGKRSKGGAIIDSPMKQGLKRPYPKGATDEQKAAQDKAEREANKRFIERRKQRVFKDDLESWEKIKGPLDKEERWGPVPRPKTKRTPPDSPMKQGLIMDKDSKKAMKKLPKMGDSDKKSERKMKRWEKHMEKRMRKGEAAPNLSKKKKRQMERAVKGGSAKGGSAFNQGYSDPDSGLKGKHETWREWRDHLADSILDNPKGTQRKKRMKREAEKKQRMTDAKDTKAKAPGIGGRKV